jgi:pimeloyl-ACP methyl ester carboxylesterase
MARPMRHRSPSAWVILGHRQAEAAVASASMMGEEVAVCSPDGTRIACWRSGSGEPLVLVHGTTADHRRWARVLPHLEAHFTVFAVDRRGRGASGDARDYRIEREFEDVVAVVAAIGGPVTLLGHSYGGICAMEAALRTSAVRRLILYRRPGGHRPHRRPGNPRPRRVSIRARAMARFRNANPLAPGQREPVVLRRSHRAAVCDAAAVHATAAARATTRGHGNCAGPLCG